MNAVLAFAKRHAPKALNFTRRWNVFFILLPSQIVLTLLGYAFFGMLDPRLAIENPFAFLMELPAMAAYAAMAMAFTVFVKLLAFNDIPRDAEDTLNKLALEGNAGARWIIIKDRLEWLVLLVIFIIFFYPSR